MYFDGIDSRQIDPIFIRSQIGYVPQDPWIITGSVKDNLSLGNDEIVDDLLIWAGKQPASIDLLTLIKMATTCMLEKRVDYFQEVKSKL